ncbi:Ctr copper transporter [Penicillium roqueforti FM164]|uniref:Copper transport protein n=2 Tax=Penicillium roqueforti TaxID=5082 RepID=W6PZJ6_PENRF|nr:Ctr copper transporter [Penicillium roqueforti FM164]
MDMTSSTSHSMSSSTSSMSMTMVFKNSHDTPLFSNAWTPASSGGFAGTCIFLIILAIIDRCLIAFKVTMERHWLAAHLNRRYVTVAGKSTEAANIDSDPDAKLASLITAQGVEESVKVVHNITHGPIPWRFSVDLPRAVLFLGIVGVSYLLMLAVMTMNIGYFCSVLGGAFLGELAVGRFIQTNEHGH